MDYFKNTKTGRVFPANEHLSDYAQTQGHLVPCDADGNRLNDDSPQDDQLERLRQENYDLKTELALYRQRENEPDVPPQGPEADTEPDQGDPVEANRMDSLVTTIGGLEKDNPDHFVPTGKRAGKPRVETLRALSGLDDISADEADAAWERFRG